MGIGGSSRDDAAWLVSPVMPQSGLRRVPSEGVACGSGSARIQAPTSLAARLGEVPRLLLALSMARWVFVHVFVVCVLVGMLVPDGEARTLRMPIAHDSTGAARAEAVNGCVMLGEPKRVAEGAQAAGGLEAVFVADQPALGFVRADGEVAAVLLDGQTLAVRASAHQRPKSPALRATPVDVDGALNVIADNASPIDRRLVPRGDGYLAAQRKKDGISLAVLSSSGSVVGSAQKIARDGQLGTPSIANVGDSALVAWAERSGDAPWTIRLAKWEPGRSAPVVASVATDAISPSLVPVGDDRAMLLWADGPVTSHRVRAQLFDRNGARAGAVLAISPEGTNAGAPKGLLNRQGRGIVAFFVATDAKMDVWAGRVSCAARGGN